MSRSIRCAIVFWLGLNGLTLGGELPTAAPAAVGLSEEKLEKLDSALKDLVTKGSIPGGVALVARHGKVAHVVSFGYRDLEKQSPMTDDTIFAIASMTKPVTCIGVMMLVEQGKLGLDDPVSRYLPEFTNLRVLGDPKNDTEAETATVPATSPITIRHLLSHTSGLSYGGFLSLNARLARVYAKAGVDSGNFATIGEKVERLAKVPLAHQPGERWTYGLSHDVLGRVIEVVSGTRFDVYLKEQIFDPLDMHDTGFAVPEAKRGRVATIYRAKLGGALAPLTKTFGSDTMFSGGAGLFSTARDYARFAQMLVNKGTLDGVKIIRPETLALMTTNQIGSNLALFLFKYGLGFGLEQSADKTDGQPATVRFFWGGIFSTNFWVDPRHDLFAVVMTQVLPTNHGNTLPIFRRGVDAAITD